jgi:uncharacterized membrane protein
MEKVIQKDKIKCYFMYFIMYAIIGWIYEVFLEVVVYKWGFTNRGVLFGPYCPVYGFGALIFIFTMYRFIEKRSLKYKLILIPFIFLGCMIIATTLELITSYFCEAIMGYWPWQTYVDYKINFQGRIALSPSIRFGIGGIIFLYILQPFFEKITKNTKSIPFNIAFYTILILFIIDVMHKVISIFNF